MALRAAIKSAVLQTTKRPCSASASRAFAALQTPQQRACMSSNSLFSEPSFSMLKEHEDPAMWLQKYERLDPSDMWKVGSFPVQNDDAQQQGLRCSEDVWDTTGMLSALSDDLPLRGTGIARGVDELLHDMDTSLGYFADSVLKKRRKKMNKHKHRKRRKAVRMRTKKN